MNDLNIFAKRAFLNTAPNVSFESKDKSYHGRGHLQRVSSMIRADQIVDYLVEQGYPARLNPIHVNISDTCVYVKPHLKKGNLDFNFRSARNYIDIIDGWGLLPLLENNPEVKVIACSKHDQELLSERLKNEIVFIPQHHCNYERQHRTRTGIETIGIIGTEDAWDHLPKGLEEELAKRKVKLLKYSKFFSRQDIIDFYMQIDLQLVWRPYRMRLSNPLKIVNASSFGIPTIAYDETTFKEVEGCYMPVKDLEGFLSELDVLRQHPELYASDSQTCIEKSDFYHIGNVAEMYKKL